MLWVLLAAMGLFPVAATLLVALRSMSPPRQGPPDPEWVARHRARPVTLDTPGRSYGAYVVEPPGASRGVVLLVHGWGSSAAEMLSWAEFLALHEWSSLAVDLRGHGSEPRHQGTTLPELAQDLALAWDWMISQPQWNSLPHMLLGHSMGGAVSLYAMAHHPVNPRATVLSSGFARVGVMTDYVLRKWKIPTFLFGSFVKLVWRLRTGVRLETLEPEETILKAPGPILVTHGSLDPVVPAKEMQRLLRNAPPGTESVEIPGAAHSDLHAFPEYRHAVVSFLERSLYSPA